MKKTILIIGILIMASLVYAQEDNSSLEELPEPYPEEEYVTPVPEGVERETPKFSTEPGGGEELESELVSPDELFGDDYEETILVNESERESYPPGAIEVVRPELLEEENNERGSMTTIIVVIIILAILAWLIVSKINKK